MLMLVVGLPLLGEEVGRPLVMLLLQLRRLIPLLVIVPLGFHTREGMRPMLRGGLLLLLLVAVSRQKGRNPSSSSCPSRNYRTPASTSYSAAASTPRCISSPGAPAVVHVDYR